ncbi:MAG: sulfur carrier protein ThiS [Acidobacteriales bacterium]|nr:sulfur carrier protein ThiS [Terriglobales bacterium]
MNLVVNGEEKSFPDSLSLADLVANLGLKPDRIAVELNREIVPRQKWAGTRLKSGDRLEIVHFVGGGRAVFSQTSRA